MRQSEIVRQAIREAEEFVFRAKPLLTWLVDAEKNNTANYATPLRSAARRKSMDLTRALAALRRP